MTDRSIHSKQVTSLTIPGLTADPQTDLEKRDAQLLRHLGIVSQPKACQDVLWSAQEAIDQLYMLEHGWAYSYRDVQDDRQQILDVFLPGDILGLRNFTFTSHGTSAAMLTHGRVVPFSLHALIDMVQSSTRLATALLAATSRQGARSTARMLASLHPEPKVRLAHFISEIHLRLAEHGQTHETHFYFPPSSSLLGSLLNLSSEQVDSAFNALEAAGMMTRHRHHVEILDKERLFREARLDITSDSAA